jgi:hypothetical protein
MSKRSRKWLLYLKGTLKFSVPLTLIMNVFISMIFSLLNKQHSGECNAADYNGGRENKLICGRGGK